MFLSWHYIEVHKLHAQTVVSPGKELLSTFYKRLGGPQRQCDVERDQESNSAGNIYLYRSSPGPYSCRHSNKTEKTGLAENGVIPQNIQESLKHNSLYTVRHEHKQITQFAV